MKAGTWSDIFVKLKKFSLNYNDFATIIENVDFLLRMITIDIYKTSKPIPYIFYIMTSIAGLAYFYVYTASMVWTVFFYYGKSGMWTEVSVVLGVSACSVICVTKFVFMKVYANEIKETVKKFLKCDSQVIPDTRFAKNLLKKLRIIKKRATVIWLSIVADAIIYILMPYVRPGKHFPTEEYLIYGLVPMLETPNYEIALFLTTITTGFGIYTMVSVASYIIVIVGYAEAQLHALSEELRHVWFDSQHHYDEMKHTKRYINVEVIEIKHTLMNEFVRIRLRDIIRFHIVNINLVHELDQELCPTLALECCIMGFSIICELLGGLKHTYLQLPFSLIHAFMDCLAGQRLIDAGNNFENAIYNCKWENFNTENKKTVLLMLGMSQKTLMLSAGGIAKLNFNCFMKILKSTYSAYTTLESTIKK